MKTQTLASAFQAALARTNQNRVVDCGGSRNGVLLAALQRSATGLDEIVSRRIGLTAEKARLAPQ